MAANDLAYLTSQIAELRAKYPHKNEEDLFVLWYLKVVALEPEEDDHKALASVTNGAGDKGVDAIYFGESSVHLVQGKYHQLGAPPAGHDEVIAFADLAAALVNDDDAAIKATIQGALIPKVRSELPKVRKLVRTRKARLYMRFVTTGSISASHLSEAKKRIPKRWRKYVDLQFVNRSELRRLVHDFVQTGMGPVPEIQLRIRAKDFTELEDQRVGLTSYLATIEASSLAEVYAEHGERVFARNVRGFLGFDKDATKGVNNAIKRTLEAESEYFWYFNNGITIVCDDAAPEKIEGKYHLTIRNGQIINGQQTTRVLHAHAGKRKAFVLVKAIEIPRTSEDEQRQHRKIVDAIVGATNKQNKVSLADLRSNDEEQLRLERALRDRYYVYSRRRGIKLSGGGHGRKITKEGLARVIAACEMDPSVIPAGKDELFNNRNYTKLFDGRDIERYLVFHWLGRGVDRAKRKDAQVRSGARWLILHQLWNELEREFQHPVFRRTFLKLCEHSWKMDRAPVSALSQAADALFDALYAMYKRDLARDEKRARKEHKRSNFNLAAFLKKPKLHLEFDKYISASKPARTAIESRIDRLIRGIEKGEPTKKAA
jgi:hypothetical protein